MAGLRTVRRLALALIALAGMVAPSSAQQPLRLGPNAGGETAPIRFAADSVKTWPANGQQWFDLRGKVFVEQGVFQVRSGRALMAVDTASQAKTGRYSVRLYAEDDVQIENGAKKQSTASAQIDLATRQYVKARPGTNVASSAPVADEFVSRGTACLTPGGIQQVQAVAAAPAPEPSPAPIPPTAPGGAVSPPPPRSAPPVPTQDPTFGVQPPPPAFQPPAPGTTLPTAPMPVGPSGPVLPANPGAAPGPARTLSIAPRRSTSLDMQSFPLSSGERATLLTGGVILTVRNVKGLGIIDIEADRLVVWSKGDSNQMITQMATPEGKVSQEAEFYLEGDVQIRSKTSQSENLLSAERVYYDVNRNVAVAVQADLEIRRTDLPDPLHMKAAELLQVSPKKYEAVDAQVFSSRLPSDPGLMLVMSRATIEDRQVPKRGLFGRPVVDETTGQPLMEVERLVRGEDMVLRVEDVPIFYLPYLQGNANDPMGPLQSVGFRQDRIFGTQVLTTWDVFNLLNMDPVPGSKWNLNADYLSQRGPALGTLLEYQGKDLWGVPGLYNGNWRLYGIHDTGTDVLGGDRGTYDDHPIWRGRVTGRHTQTFFDDWSFQGQVSALSDKNFLEQFYKYEFDTAPNQQTYLYLKRQRDNWNASFLVQPNIRSWVTEDVWLPRADFNLVGQSFFDLFTYNLRSNAGYAQLHTTTQPPPAYLSTDQPDTTGRFDVYQDLSLPFYLGPVKVTPYGVLDLTYYTNDYNNEANGRVYGGGGVRATLPFTKLYPGINSDLFNLKGINHKVVWGLNYFNATSSDPLTLFPTLDRLYDDATDQALRDIRPRQPFLNPPAGWTLFTQENGGYFDPRYYALRRLIDNRTDTLDTIEVLQANVRNRWQTKRGFEGMEHIVDYFTLDLSGSFFPNPNRDNFGQNFAFLEYDAIWNVGDRTSIVSTGLYDPFDQGARIFTIGGFLNRPDRTSFFLGYRMIDPLQSRAVTAAATYIFSPKYKVTAAATYDFGINEAMSNSLIVTRTGTDLTVSLGVTYNAIVNNFGVTLEILPNVVAMTRKSGQGLLTQGLYR